MSEKEKPLRRPPKTPFGGRRFEEEENVPLTADKMAAAMAEGKLEEFMKEEMPDNDYARALAAMMMGMTGMMPPGAYPSGPEEGAAPQPEKTEKTKPAEGTPSGVEPPEDVMEAVRSGDVKGVMGLLEREHKKRIPGEEAVTTDEGDASDRTGLSDEEKETLNQVIKIASENDVSVDWAVLRALKLYIREYQKTGRL